MKKKLIIIIGIIVAVIGILIGLYFYGLTPVSKSNKIVLFTVNNGDSKTDIVNNLKDSKLIKSKMSLYIYVILNRDLNLQAGIYELSPNLSATEILNKINDGKIKKEKADTFKITFVEGKRLPFYANKIAEATNTTKEEVMAVLSDKEYLKELINTYSFLNDDILNEDIYYPLEGYLFPSTYEFYKGAGVKDIVKTMLDTLDSKLKSYSDKIESSKYSIHEIITLASIVEVEGANASDRKGVSGVFYNRLKDGWSLGSDATTYYAAKVDFSERDLYRSEINDINAYNTRQAAMAGKLPVGPICSPSMESLIAAIEPDNHDYYYFVADKNKKTYFMKTESEHIKQINDLKSAGLWYTYK